MEKYIIVNDNTIEINSKIFDNSSIVKFQNSIGNICIYISKENIENISICLNEGGILKVYLRKSNTWLYIEKFYINEGTYKTIIRNTENIMYDSISNYYDDFFSWIGDKKC